MDAAPPTTPAPRDVPRQPRLAVHVMPFNRPEGLKVAGDPRWPYAGEGSLRPRVSPSPDNDSPFSPIVGAARGAAIQHTG